MKVQYSNAVRASPLCLLVMLLVATAARADGTGWFTADQAAAGRWAYEAR